MALGARIKFGAPMFEPDVFRKQMYCKESACEIVWTFWRPHHHSVPPAVFQHPQSDSAPMELRPLAPLVKPLLVEP